MAAATNNWRALVCGRALSIYKTLPRRATSLSLSLLQLIAIPTVVALGQPQPARAATAVKHVDISQTGQSDQLNLTKAGKTSPEARALADKILEALGGFDNFKEFNDLPCRGKGKIVQTSSISNVVNTFECDLLVKREKQKITIKFLGEPLTTVYDGKECWTKQGDSIMPSDKETARRIEEDIQHGFLLLESINEPATILQVGKPETIAGKDCDTLIVWANDGLPTTFYADKDKHIIIASSYPGIDLEQGLKIEKMYHYLDYRPIGKTIQPFKVLEFSGSKKVSETIIDSIVADDTITDATFTMPKEVVPPRLLAGPVTIPFDYSSNEIIIQATVNGTKELRFIVDTGATQSIIDKTLARQVGTPTESNLSMTTGSGSIQTEAVKVDKLSIGDLQLTNIPFATADLSTFGGAPSTRPAGLIGANVLKRFLMTIDYENQKITFADPTKVDVPPGATAVNTTPSLGMAGMAVEGNIDGKQKVTFLIDTGAALTNVAESKVKSILSGPLYKVGMVKGLDGKVVQTASVRFNYLDLDGLRIDKPVFSVASEPLAGQISPGIIHSKDLAILGNPTLGHYTVSFDYRGQRLIFSQSKSQKAMAEFGNKIDAIKLEWLKTNNANPAVRELSSLADSAHNRDLPAMEAIARAELALALCQKNGGSFSPDKLFAPIKSEELLAESGEGSGKDEKPSAAEKLFGDSEGQLLTAFNLSERCTDKTIQGRVLAAWGLMYASQDRDIHYLSSAKQKLGKAVALAPTDADVLAASGYFLSRLDSFKPRAEAETIKKSAPKVVAQGQTLTVAKSGASRASRAEQHTKNKSNQPVASEKSDGERTVVTFKNATELGKWLVDQIVDQAIMIDPGNWLALWTKYERVKSQGKSEDMKLIAGQLKHYFPTLTSSPP
jgi:clan AA aspartic protease (TIGR02281 family)